MYYGQEFYIPGANVPQVFLDADRIMHKRIEQEHPDWLIKRAEPKRVPMPFIAGKPKNGPVYVTEEWYFKKKRKQEMRKAKEKKDLQIDIMEYQSRIKVIYGKLAKLDPYKKKDAKKMLELNEELKDLKCMIEAIEKTTGKKAEDLEEGSKLMRALAFIESKFKAFKKKVNKFIHRNEDLIIGVLSVGIPLMIYGIFQAIFKIPIPTPPPAV